MTKEERYELIEAYLLQKMDGLQQREFEDMLDRDPLLQEELAIHKGLHEAISNKKLGYFEELIQKNSDAYFEEGRNKAGLIRPNVVRWGMAIAAGLIILLLTYLGLKPQANEQELFAEVFEPYQAPAVFRSEETMELNKELLLAMAAYDQADFEKAVGHFDLFLEEQAGAELAIFLRGISYLALDSLNKAQEDLQTILGKKESLFYAQTTWYQGLLYLRQGKKEAAIEVLQTIEDETRVQTLLKQL